MPKTVIRTYSHYTRDAIEILGGLIRSERIEQKLTAAEVSERAGISRGLLQRIEKGDPKCVIGAAFEVAALLGISLFDSDHKGLEKHKNLLEDKLALLPKSVRNVRKAVQDDF
jgi:transcriptional regulator with XRE-family HTH domain